MLSDEVYAIIRVDNHSVGQTESKSVGKMSWDQHFSLDLDRVKIFKFPILFLGSGA